MSGLVARVVLDSPLPQLDRAFEYAVPEQVAEQIGAGMRVKVPLRTGGRIVNGYVLGITDTPEYTGKLAQLDKLVSTARVLTPEIAQLARAVADRQAGSMSDVLRLAIPARSARLEQQWLDDSSGERAARADRAGAMHVDLDALSHRYGTAFDSLGSLRASVRVPVGMRGTVPQAMAAVVAVAARALVRGESAIVLVPDYRDLEVALDAASGLVSPEVVRSFDSRLKPMPRYEQFLRALEPVPQLIIGTRAAVYAPAHRLGSIVMWDDGDESFAEPHAPYAHAREVAMMRAQQHDCEFVLAGHCPSLEARRLVQGGWLREIAPLHPAHPRIIPTAATLGDNSAQREARIPSVAWRAASEAVKLGPVLVQVGRAGYRPHLACARCRTLATCDQCGGRLQQTSPHKPASCQVCGHVQADWQCPVCESRELRSAAIGHQRTAEELGRAFPNTRIVIADGEERLVRVSSEPQLVVATRGAEPIPDGGYRAVLLLDAEAALARESLDTTVAALRAWSNAAALVHAEGTVLISGHLSDPVAALRNWHQPAWSDAELAQRRELGFPPAVRVGVISGTDDDVTAAVRRLTDLDDLAVQVLGPVPLLEEPGRVRAVIRFGYRDGARVAAALRAEIITRATAARRATRQRTATLRIHLDAPGVF